MSTVNVDQFLIGSGRNFVYLVTSEAESVVIDPQEDLRAWETRMNALGSRLTGVVLTHTHWDHVAGVPAINKKYAANGIKIYVHERDAKRLEKYPPSIRDRFAFVSEGDTITVGATRLEVLHTPGHSGGECCYLLAGSPAKLFSGDTVFVGEVGRTDLETGSTRELFETIQRLKKLDSETIIYPGHDYGRTPTSTIGRECKESAAFRCHSIEEFDAIP